jgi:anti-anti-sigma factor
MIAAPVLAAGPHLVLTGDLGPDAAERLRAQLVEAATPGAVVRISLAEVTALSLPVLGVLVQAWRRLAESGGRLVVQDVSGPASRVLRTSGLYLLLTDGQATVDLT